MPLILLTVCCFLVCPVVIGAFWYFIGSDRELRRLERDVRRLNAQADARAAGAVTPGRPAGWETLADALPALRHATTAVPSPR